MGAELTMLAMSSGSRVVESGFRVDGGRDEAGEGMLLVRACCSCS